MPSIRRFGGTVAHLALWSHRHWEPCPICRMIISSAGWVTPPLSALSDTGQRYEGRVKNLVSLVRTCSRLRCRIAYPSIFSCPISSLVHTLHDPLAPCDPSCWPAALLSIDLQGLSTGGRAQPDLGSHVVRARCALTCNGRLGACRTSQKTEHRCAAKRGITLH